MILLFMYSFNIILCEKIVQQFIIIILISYHSYITFLNKLMFSLTSADEKLVVSQKRNGFFVEKSPIAGIHVNDEVIELNHVKVELLNDVAVKRHLSEPIFILPILLINKEHLINDCLKANNINVEKSERWQLKYKIVMTIYCS